MTVDRIDPPAEAGEAETLLGFLDYQRATLRWKCAGLGAAQLRMALPPSSLTLAGLMKHMAVVEAWWFNLTFAGGIERPSWFGDLDPEDEDWSFTSALEAEPAQLVAWLDEAIAVSDRVVADALARPEGLSATAARDDGTAVSLRWILCHMIEEYARHNGHADLLRQSIDGSTGE